jgi:hypothetical protein
MLLVLYICINGFTQKVKQHLFLPDGHSMRCQSCVLKFSGRKGSLFSMAIFMGKTMGKTWENPLELGGTGGAAFQPHDFAKKSHETATAETVLVKQGRKTTEKKHIPRLKTCS